MSEGYDHEPCCPHESTHNGVCFDCYGTGHTHPEDEAPRPRPDMLTAALWYAAQGLRVFPLTPLSKKPWKGSNGRDDASSNADVVRGWWETSPDANIGLATGHGVDVFDFDPPQGQVTRAQMWDTVFSRVEEAGIAKVLTPRPGGMHIWVPSDGSGNRAGVAPSVDYRGKGGYVLVPPSVLAPYEGCPAGGRYRFLANPNLGGLR